MYAGSIPTQASIRNKHSTRESGFFVACVLGARRPRRARYAAETLVLPWDVLRHWPDKFSVRVLLWQRGTAGATSVPGRSGLLQGCVQADLPDPCRGSGSTVASTRMPQQFSPWMPARVGTGRAGRAIGSSTTTCCRVRAPAAQRFFNAAAASCSGRCPAR